MGKQQIKEAIQAAVLCFVVAALVGYVVSARQNLMKYSKDLSGRFEFAVFLSSNVTAPEVVGEKIRAMKNVNTMTFMSKEAVKEKLKNFRGEILLAGENPFPDTFSVTLSATGLSSVREAEASLKAISGIEEVRYDNTLLSLLEKINQAARLTDAALRAILTVFFIMFLAGIFVDYFGDRHHFAEKLSRSWLRALGAAAGAALAAAIVVFAKKLFGLDDSSLQVPLKWAALIFVSGAAAGYFGSLHNRPEKQEKHGKHD